jgi:hypothetical protein
MILFFLCWEETKEKDQWNVTTKVTSKLEEPLKERNPYFISNLQMNQEFWETKEKISECADKLSTRWCYLVQQRTFKDKENTTIDFIISIRSTNLL